MFTTKVRVLLFNGLLFLIQILYNAILKLHLKIKTTKCNFMGFIVEHELTEKARNSLKRKQRILKSNIYVTDVP